MYKKNTGKFLPGDYVIKTTQHVFKITKRSRYHINCKGATAHYDATHTGMRIYYDEARDDHYILVAIQDGGAARVYDDELLPRGLTSIPRPNRGRLTNGDIFVRPQHN